MLLSAHQRLTMARAARDRQKRRARATSLLRLTMVDRRPLRAPGPLPCPCLKTICVISKGKKNGCYECRPVHANTGELSPVAAVGHRSPWAHQRTALGHFTSGQATKGFGIATSKADRAMKAPRSEVARKGGGGFASSLARLLQFVVSRRPDLAGEPQDRASFVGALRGTKP